MSFVAPRSGTDPLSLKLALVVSAAVVISACTQARNSTRPASGGSGGASSDGASSDGPSDRMTPPDAPTSPDAADAPGQFDAGSGADLADTRGTEVPAPTDGAAPPDARDNMDAGTSGAVVLASGQNKPSGIALSATDVYWATQDGTILRCAKTGCGQSAPVVVASGQGAPLGLARSGSVLYWRTTVPPDGGVRAVMKCDSEPCGTGQPFGLSLPSGPTFTNQIGLATDSQRIYASLNASLVSCPLSGCGDAGTSANLSGQPPLPLPLPLPMGIAADATRLFVTRRGPGAAVQGAVSSCSSPTCTNGTILVPTTPFPFAVAEDSTDVYWSEYDFPNGSGEAAIRTCPLAGCDVTTARVVASGAIGPFALALDDTNVYYTDYLNGRVVAVPKHQTSEPCAPNHLIACCGGVYRCDGTCTAALPANYGNSCSTCGGTVSCDGTCSIPNCIAGGVTLYRVTVPSIGPHAMTAGPDGNIWFTDGSGNQIGRIAGDGTVTTFAIPTANSNPWGITTGPDGNLWFTEYQGPKVGTITPAGVITEFTSPLINFPTGIASAPDGALWFLGVTSVERITTGGSVSDFTPDLGTPPDAGVFANSPNLAVGSDGRLWYPLGMATIVRFETMASAGVGTAAGFALPTVTAQPGGITKGPDGNFWFTETNVDKIGRITPAGVITEFPLAAAGSRPVGITAGVDGNLWFAEQGRNGIGRITPAGVVTEYLLPPGGTATSFSSTPTLITSAPDGNIWFVGSSGGSGRFHP